ncbi:MAG: LptF/LptG family permease, partial [Candidatus Gastranaerophilaceae bacterium]
IFALVMSVCSFIINESIVPIMTKQSKDLALWALGQKNIPEGKQNFVFKELNDGGSIKRLFYVGYCENKVLHNITVLDTAKEGTIQILQADEGKTSPEGWDFEKGAVYTVGNDGKILNTALFDKFIVKFGLDMSKELNKNVAKEMNFSKLIHYINHNQISDEQKNIIHIELYDKLALPLTTIALVLIGVPLALTPPRYVITEDFIQYSDYFCILPH